jgi:hypothetical protein
MGFQIFDELQAVVQGVFPSCAVHPYIRLSPSCAIQNVVPVACVCLSCQLPVVEIICFIAFIRLANRGTVWNVKLKGQKIPYIIRNISFKYNQQDATLYNILCCCHALHFSGGFSAHHQELKLYIQRLVYVKLACCYR